MKKINDNKFYFITTFGLLGLSAFMYFFIKLFVSDYNLIESPLDHYIPFLPIFIYIYMIWYPFEIFSLYHIYKTNKEVYIKSIISLALSFLMSSTIFLLYPTTVDRQIVNSYNSLTSLITYITFKADTPAINCFPSNHCILCFTIIFSTLSIKKLHKWKKYTIVIVNILIILSTLLVKQHVIYDVLGSLVITLINFYLLSKFKFFKKLERRLANTS